MLAPVWGPAVPGRTGLNGPNSLLSVRAREAVCARTFRFAFTPVSCLDTAWEE
jgi:hypothetical protein